MAADGPSTLDAWAAARMGLPLPLTAEAVTVHQLTRIRETVAHARTCSPFYRSRSGWPEDSAIRGFDDLARLPFTDAADLVRGDPPLVAVPQSAVARIVTLDSSGTAGPPKRIHFTAEEVEDTVDFFHHGMALFARPGDRAVIAFPAERPGSVGASLSAAARRLGVEPVTAAADLTAGDFVALLRECTPAVLFGPPVRLLAAARVSASDGGPRVAVRAALVSADRIPAALRALLRDLWGCEVFAHWGMTETGLGGAVECACHTGLHVREPDLYVEVVDPATGAPRPPGTAGEIVVTTLRRRGLPLLRYRTGDRGRLLTGSCACGSVLRRLDTAVERIGGGAVLEDGSMLTLGTLDDALFGLDAVTDVAAAVTEGWPMRLAITVATPPALRGPRVCAMVRERLAGVPVIGGALASGTLALDVSLGGDAQCRHRGKRRLRIGDDDGTRRPRPAAALFDLDGTLVHSVADVHDALNGAMAEAGLAPLPLEAVKRIVGGGARRLIEGACHLHGWQPEPDRRDALVARYLALYGPRSTRLTTLAPGAQEAVRRLAGDGVRLAVVTNKATADARSILTRFGLAGSVDAVIGGDAGPPAKPAPDLLLLACRILGVAPADAVVIGDSAYDVDAARAAGMPAIAVRGGCSEQGADRLGADAVIDTLADLPAMMRTLMIMR